MKILLDKCVHEGLRHHLPGTVHTARYMGWGSLPNGKLLDEAERHGYDVVVTADSRMIVQGDRTRCLR